MRFGILKRFPLLFLTALLFTLTGCKDEETKVLTATVQYDIVLPEEMMKIADAYITYTDVAGAKTEQAVNGVFKKTLAFRWEGAEADAIHNDYQILSIEYRLKVPEESLQEGVMLLNDSNAYTKVTFDAAYTITKESNGFSGNNTSVSTDGNKDSVRFVITDKQKKHKWSVEEQIAYFNIQTSTPFARFSNSIANHHNTLSARFNIGLIPEVD